VAAAFDPFGNLLAQAGDAEGGTGSTSYSYAAKLTQFRP